VAETIDQIEKHIDWTREQLGEDFRELEHKVSAATDWRAHYERAPLMYVGAAVVSGAVLGSVLSGKRQRRTPMLAARSPRMPSESHAPGQTYQFVSNLTTALVGLGLTKLTAYIDEMLPGFDEHYRRAERGEPV
jgi:hypothetical protein